MADEPKEPKEPEEPKMVTVRYIDEGEDDTEEAALHGLIEGFRIRNSPEGQAKLKEFWEKKN